MIDIVLRLAHQYDLNEYREWGVAHRKRYPSVNNSITAVYAHGEWTVFREPNFYLRVIQLTMLLKREDLDGIAALAYFRCR